MQTLNDNALASKLAKPLGEKSLSSSLATALKFARVVVSLLFAFALVGAIIGIPLSIAAATHLLPVKVFNQLHPGGNILTTWTVAIPYLVYGVIATRGALLIVRRLQGVFSTLVANQPFVRGNAAHLRAIWVTLVVIEIARIVGFVLMHGLTVAFAAGQKVAFPSGLDDPIDLVRWFVIFVVLILAEVFRQGAQLREDTELTV